MSLPWVFPRPTSFEASRDQMLFHCSQDHASSSSTPITDIELRHQRFPRSRSSTLSYDIVPLHSLPILLRPATSCFAPSHPESVTSGARKFSLHPDQHILHLDRRHRVWTPLNRWQSHLNRHLQCLTIPTSSCVRQVSHVHNTSLSLSTSLLPPRESLALRKSTCHLHSASSPGSRLSLFTLEKFHLVLGRLHPTSLAHSRQLFLFCVGGTVLGS